MWIFNYHLPICGLQLVDVSALHELALHRVRPSGLRDPNLRGTRHAQAVLAKLGGVLFEPV
jgi:hypothetical protein